jgi:hypothetical protein
MHSQPRREDAIHGVGPLDDDRPGLLSVHRLCGGSSAVAQQPQDLFAALACGWWLVLMCCPAGFWLAGDVARCEPDLLTARLDGPAREIKLLSDHRHHLTTERTVFTPPRRRAARRQALQQHRSRAPAAGSLTQDWHVHPRTVRLHRTSRSAATGRVQWDGCRILTHLACRCNGTATGLSGEAHCWLGIVAADPIRSPTYSHRA